MSKVTRILKYRREDPVRVDGPDLAPDQPQDVSEFIIEKGRGTPYGLAFARGGIFSGATFIEPNPPGALTRLRVTVASMFKRKVKFDGDTILFANSYYRNYYHFVIEGLPRIFLAREYLRPGAKIVCPDDIQTFHKQWFELIGVDHLVVYVPNSVVVVGKRLVACSFSAPGDNHHRVVLRDFRRWVVSKADRKDAAVDPLPQAGRKYLIGRRPGLRRAIVNLAEVQAVCARHGYDYAELDGMTLKEQRELFRGASDLVAIHGAGLANLLFCREGTRVVELRSSEFHNRTFEKMAIVLRLDHTTLPCEPLDRGEDMATKNHTDIIVDVRKLKRLLAR